MQVLADEAFHKDNSCARTPSCTQAVVLVSLSQAQGLSLATCQGSL